MWEFETTGRLFVHQKVVSAMIFITVVCYNPGQKCPVK